MKNRTRVRKKVPSMLTSTEESRQLESSSFNIQTQKKASSQAITREELDTQDQWKKKVGFNPANLSVVAPGRTPPPPVQTKLTIGKPGDKYEQEADKMTIPVVNQMNSNAFVSKQSTQNQTEQMQNGQVEKDTIQRWNPLNPLKNAIKHPMRFSRNLGRVTSHYLGTPFRRIRIKINEIKDEGKREEANILYGEMLEANSRGDLTEVQRIQRDLDDLMAETGAGVGIINF